MFQGKTKKTAVISGDLRQGITGNIPGLICPVVLGLFFWAEFVIRLPAGFGKETATWGEWLLYVYGGMPKFIPAVGEPFVFPVRWMLIMVLASYSVLYYPFRDMDTIGLQLLVRSQSRRLWWMSKIIWNIVYTCLFHFLMAGTGVFCSLFFGFPVSLKIELTMLQEMMKLDYEGIRWGIKTMGFVAVFVPMLISAAVNQTQMMLSLIIKPLYAFIVSIFIYLSSAYYQVIFLLGNYAMILRLEPVGESGLYPVAGWAVGAGLALASAGLGTYIFVCRYDILAGNQKITS